MYEHWLIMVLFHIMHAGKSDLEAAIAVASGAERVLSNVRCV
jgi:hypothetical protein